MKNIIRILGVALVAGSMLLWACEKNPDPEPTPTPTPTDTTDPTDPVDPNDPVSQFVGTWNLSATAYDAHIVMLGNATDTTYENQPMTITITRTSGNNVAITGSITLTFMSGINIPLEFSTTGVVTEDGLTAEPCHLDDTYTLNYGQYSAVVDYVGTMNFNNPTAYPERGILTVTGSVEVEGEETAMGLGEVSASCDAIVAQGTRATKAAPLF